MADIRDESAEDIRIVLEPKSRRVEAEVVMENLFRLSDLEIRVPLNLNVLDHDGRPVVMDLRMALNAWLGHRRVVLQRRSKYRLARIKVRLEVLEGYLTVFLNIDEVISIIREVDHPRDKLIQQFGLNENQANAILDMRLRALRRLEEMALRSEREKLVVEQGDLNKLLLDEAKQWSIIYGQIKDIKSLFIKTDKRKTQLSQAPSINLILPKF